MQNPPIMDILVAHGHVSDAESPLGRPFNLSGFSDRFDRVERVLAVTFDRNKHVQNQFHLSNLML